MGIVIAIETFHTAGRDGNARTVYAGQAIPDSDPVVAANRTSFRTPEQMASATVVEHHAVEQATAAPGERRDIRHPRGRAR